MCHYDTALLADVCVDRHVSHVDKVTDQNKRKNRLSQKNNGKNLPRKKLFFLFGFCMITEICTQAHNCHCLHILYRIRLFDSRQYKLSLSLADSILEDDVKLKKGKECRPFAIIKLFTAMTIIMIIIIIIKLISQSFVLSLSYPALYDDFIHF